MPFDRGLTLEVSEMLHSGFYLDMMRKIPTIERVLKQLNLPVSDESPAAIASAMEFILEGLYVNRRISKVRLGNRRVYER